jgi:acyl-CoA reductase-like NAD-dependent aldehyde dehydrogenase
MYEMISSVVVCGTANPADDHRRNHFVHHRCSDTRRARTVAGRLQAGSVFINGLQFEPLAPFGGFKQSGMGREGGTFGLDAYLEPKTVLGGPSEDA